MRRRHIGLVAIVVDWSGRSTFHSVLHDSNQSHHRRTDRDSRRLGYDSNFASVDYQTSDNSTHARPYRTGSDEVANAWAMGEFFRHSSSHGDDAGYDHRILFFGTSGRWSVRWSRNVGLGDDAGQSLDSFKRSTQQRCKTISFQVVGFFRFDDDCETAVAIGFDDRPHVGCDAAYFDDGAFRSQPFGTRDRWLSMVGGIEFTHRKESERPKLFGSIARCQSLFIERFGHRPIANPGRRRCRLQQSLSASQPKVWGISTRLADFEESQPAGQTFAWAAREKNVDALSKSSAWRLLEKAADGTVESPLPVIVDQNTAMWALHLTGGIGQTFHYEMEGRELHFKMVGQLQNTIMQGSLMIGEENFKRVFPSISGYRSWLVHVPSADRVSEVGKILENGWSDEGMDAVDSSFVLQNLLAVQNTYLKAFQSLGALGLLLGSIGLAVVQMRSVMERRSELGLLRAIGFTRERVGRWC